MPAPGPQLPKPEEQERRRLTHIPYADGCTDIVATRGRSDSHKMQPGVVDAPPLAEIDYTYMRTSELDDLIATVLIGMLKRVWYGFGVVSRVKGRGDQFAVLAAVRWL